MDTTTITPEFEIFDQKLISGGNHIYYVDINGSATEIISSLTGTTYRFTPQASYFTILKNYYSNNKVENKGLYFNISWGGFKKGIWYYFKPDGSLKETIDYDKLYPLTWERLLEWLRQKNIPVVIGPVKQGTGYHTLISRYVSENGTPYWKVEWLKRSDTVEEIIINAKTGVTEKPVEHHYFNN